MPVPAPSSAAAGTPVAMPVAMPVVLVVVVVAAARMVERRSRENWIWICALREALGFCRAVVVETRWVERMPLLEGRHSVLGG